MSRVVLASGSPQRRAILEQLGIEFTVEVPVVDELEAGPPHEVALENAFRKASAVAAGVGGAAGMGGVAGVGGAAGVGGVAGGAPARGANRDLVLGVDTVVSLGARLYGKPADADEARATLHALAGRRHSVVSGICLIEDGRARTAAATTVVEFRALDEPLIDWYVASGEWRGRAGGYAIQGRGAALVAGVEGDFLNVVGLSVATLLELVPGLLV